MRRLVVILLAAATLTMGVRGAVPCEMFPYQAACYVAVLPGPVANALELVTIETADAAAAGGQLLVTTVVVRLEQDTGEWLQGSLSPRVSQIRREVLYPPGTDREDFNREAAAQMANSQLDATIAALRHRGFEIDETFDGAEVLSVDEAGPATDRLRNGDVIVAVAGDPVSSSEEAVAAIERRDPGDRVSLAVLRDGDERIVTVVLGRNPEVPDAPLLGVTLRSFLDLPVDVSIDPGEVGGPSAGLMFALAVVDVLDPVDLTGGRVIAGTGAIDRSGRVGEIGLVQQKIFGAVSRGDDSPAPDVFLVPDGDLDAARETGVDADLLLVPVDSLQDAVTALQDLRRGQRPADAVRLLGP